MANIGARSLDEIIGRADLLGQVSRGSDHLDDLDLNPLLITVDGAEKSYMIGQGLEMRSQTHWTKKLLEMLQGF